MTRSRLHPREGFAAAACSGPGGGTRNSNIEDRPGTAVATLSTMTRDLAISPTTCDRGDLR